MVTKPLSVLFVMLFGLTVQVHAQDAKKDLAKLQGDWSVTALILRGGEDAPKSAIGVTFTFKGDKMTMHTGDGAEKRREFTIKIDPTKKPSEIDATPLDGPYKGKLAPAIYQLNGDNLKICIPNRDGKDRPTEFKTDAAGDYVLITLVRKKK